VNRTISAGVAYLAFATCGIAQQSSSGNGSLPSALPLLQIERLSGDQHDGFTQSCLLVYGDGKYHREIRRQVNTQYRPQPDWKSPEVFESAISPSDLEHLREIIESRDFRAIVGTLGDASALRSRLVFWPNGVVPHSDIDIFEAAVAHSKDLSKDLQVFRLFGAIGRAPTSSLKSFREWVAAVEGRKEGRVANTAVDFCSARTPSSNDSTSRDPTPFLGPKPINARLPEYLAEESKAGHSGDVTIHFMINPDGSVGAVSVQRGLNPTLDQFALEAVKHWTFAPARLYGIAIAMPLNLELHFPPTRDSPR